MSPATPQRLCPGHWLCALVAVGSAEALGLGVSSSGMSLFRAFARFLTLFWSFYPVPAKWQSPLYVMDNGPFVPITLKTSYCAARSLLVMM